MGCITSRDVWPPKPYPHFVVRSVVRDGDRFGVDCSITMLETDFVWVWPGAAPPCRGLLEGPKTDWQYEASPWQENAIRSLEG